MTYIVLYHGEEYAEVDSLNRVTTAIERDRFLNPAYITVLEVTRQWAVTPGRNLRRVTPKPTE